MAKTSNTKTAKDYTASVFSGPRVSLVQGLFSQYYDGLSTPTSKAAFQVALWEIMRESGSTLDASAGSFRVGATYGSVATLANDYLANAASYVPEFSAAMIKLNKGQVTDAPVKSQFGFHVIRLDDVREAQLPKLEEVKPQIAQQLQQQKLGKFQEDLRAKAKIE